MWLSLMVLVVAAIASGTADIRINGGRNVTLREFSYQVSIQHGVTRQHVGGGVFIGRYTVLTAAHIIAQAGPNATQIHIRYNSLNHGSGGSLRQAHRVIIHPNFNPGTLEHDIAIIKLQRAVRGVVRADLPSRRSSLNINDTLTISGWGQRTGARNITATLEAVDLQVTDQQRCAAAYQPLHNFPNVTNGMLCAAWLNNDRGACPGTEGGPAVRRERRNTIVYGLVSWSNGCGTPRYPNVFTRVSEYLRWIGDNR